MREMRVSAEEGNVAAPKRAEPISEDDEKELWQKGILGSGTPTQLQESLIYCLGIQLGLRAAAEHKQLKFGNNSQLKLITENGEKVLRYTEHVSKCKKLWSEAIDIGSKICKNIP